MGKLVLDLDFQEKTCHLCGLHSPAGLCLIFKKRLVKSRQLKEFRRCKECRKAEEK